MARSGPGLTELRKQLRGDVPAAVERLGDAHLLELAHAIRDARRREGEALADAGDRALQRIPRLLRGPVRKIVG